MSDLAAKNARYENDRGPWVIRHPDASPLAPWYVALLPVDLDDPASPVNPGLLAGTERAQEALQFAREIDAVLYRRAHLTAGIAWVIEALPRRSAPPIWGVPEPDLLLEALQDMEAEDAATVSLRP
jgi:hypothetical protein